VAHNASPGVVGCDTLDGTLIRVALHPTRRLVESLVSADRTLPELVGLIVPVVGRNAGRDPMRPTYSEYLASEDWREYRAAIIARQRGKCATCPRDATHCHHRTYEHLGWEADDDCVGLCADCHRSYHVAGAR